MPRYEEWNLATPQRKLAIAAANLRENPHIAAWHFHTRFTLFMKEVIGPKFGVTDHFNRCEWQGRGSTHSHGLNWVPEGLDGSHINDDDDEGRQARADFTAFWGQHVVAYNPNPSLPPFKLPPIALPTDLQENTEAYLTSILNRVQIRQYSEAYYLRIVKDSSEKKCRFYFPHALRDEAVLTKEFNPNYWMFAL
jgi:ATP-dependent DNA helicase PIF1